MKKEEQKQSWQINSSFKRSRERERERKSRTKLDIDSVRGQAYKRTQRCCVPKGVRGVGRRHCKFWGATKYGRINMFKIFMCPSAVQLLLWRRHFVFSGLTKTATPPPPRAHFLLLLHPPTWLALSCVGAGVVGTRFGNEPGWVPSTCVYFYLRQWQKVNENCREGERERKWERERGGGRKR